MTEETGEEDLGEQRVERRFQAVTGNSPYFTNFHFLHTIFSGPPMVIFFSIGIKLVMLKLCNHFTCKTSRYVE